MDTIQIIMTLDELKRARGCVALTLQEKGDHGANKGEIKALEKMLAEFTQMVDEMENDTEKEHQVIEVDFVKKQKIS